MEITELLAKYGSDKVNPHTYGEAYEELFQQFDQEGNLNILEIGIQKGGSLRAWKEYFPNAQVTGVDIVDEVSPELRSNDINYAIQDINDFKTDEMYDIVIDDGSHWLKDVVHSVALLSKQLKVGGIMVIEDVQNHNVWYDCIATITNPTLEYNKGFKWSISFYNGSKPGLEDNYMFVLQRKL